MSLCREDVYATLFGLTSKIEGVKIRSRKLTHWTDCPEFPAVYMHQLPETVVKTGRGIPSIHTLHVEFYVYVKVPGNDDPAPHVNRLVDAVCDAVAPAIPGAFNKQTLGGLVQDCWVDGDIMNDEGVLGETGVAIIPVSILYS